MLAFGIWCIHYDKQKPKNELWKEAWFEVVCVH